MTSLFGVETIIDTIVQQVVDDIHTVIPCNPVVCFAEGTFIRTVNGDVAVEALAIGDLVVTASGEHRPIRWIGHRKVECSRHPKPEFVRPIRIMKGAFGPDRPSSDLTVSPGHAICINVVDELFVPSSALVNDATVVQLDVAEVTYWHVELDTHDVLLANGCPAESYLDVGNRAFFVENDTVSMDAGPDAAHRPDNVCCRPFVDSGSTVEAIRWRMRDRATAMGWSRVETSMDDLHLLVDGVRIDPDTSGLKARFVVSASAKVVWLVSNSSVPYHFGEFEDRRRLGTAFSGMTIDDGLGVRVSIGPDDSRLSTGFHDFEAGSSRWTNGRAHLPADLWKDCKGTFFLSLDLSGARGQRWVEPAKTDVAAVASAA